MTLETPSGKGAADENFPVGSFLIAKALRPAVARYYAYARAIDDVADNPALPAPEKIARLKAFAAAIHSESDDPAVGTASAARSALRRHAVPLRHASDLTIAFIQDAEKNRYASWAELMGYCENSANPVGRFLLALHGEKNPAAFTASDALCSALQVLNHLQDCGDDYRTLDRCYLPQDWMAAAEAQNDELRAARLSPALRQVLDRCLTATDRLLAAARPLAGLLQNRRLAMESAAIWRIAMALSRKLKTQDPLAKRVELSKPRALVCALQGVLAVLLRLGEGRRP